MRSILVFCVLLCVKSTFASQVPVHGFSEAENTNMLQENRAQLKSEMRTFSTTGSIDSFLNIDLLKTTEARPFAEYENAGYLIFSSDFAFSSKKAKKTMAKYLPDGVQLLVFADSIDKKKALRIKKQFSEHLPVERITVLHAPGASNGFWARDGVPVPVFRTPIDNSVEIELFSVVDAKYPRFERDKLFSQLFASELTRYDYFFEGGNFMANSKNECLVVNKPATASIPDHIFRNHYGCQVLTRLPFVKGIGHADESVKFIDDTTVLTDEASYVAPLQERGYTVVMLPRPNRRYETYVNSLIVNGTVFVPIFGQRGDEKALQVYRDAGFDQVIGIDSQILSNQGLGSLHCITMTYPQVSLADLVEETGAVVVH